MLARKLLSLAVYPSLLWSFASPCLSSFEIDSSAAQATKEGFASAGSWDEYPTAPDTGIDDDDTNAGTSDGASDQDSYTWESLSVDLSATASGSSTAATPAAAPALVGSLQAVAGTSVAGGAMITVAEVAMSDSDFSMDNKRIPIAYASYDAEHSAQTTVTGTAVNNGPYNLVLVGKLYTAVIGGGAASYDGDYSWAEHNFGGMATANVEGHTSNAGFGEEDSLTDFQTFVVTIPDEDAGITAFAMTSANVDGYVSIDLFESASGNAGGTAVGVAAAYAWLIPDTGPAFSESGFERMTVTITEGDNSFDNILNGDDISRLAEEVRDRTLIGGADPYSVFSGAEPLFDADYDLEVTYGVNYSSGVASDSDYLIRTLLGTEYGDVNLDGVVDTDDRTIIYAHWNGTGGWAEGDITGDGYINSADWGVWRDFEGFGVSLGIPEPTSTCLLLSLLPLASPRRRLR